MGAEGSAEGQGPSSWAESSPGRGQDHRSFESLLCHSFYRMGPSWTVSSSLGQSCRLEWSGLGMLVLWGPPARDTAS